MNFLRLALLLVMFTVSASRAEDTNALPKTITIGNETHEDVQWGRVTAYAVSIRHKSGIASIPLAKLPPELQSYFHYDPKKAAAQHSQELTAQEQQRRADAELAAKLKAQAEADAQTAAAEEAARKAKEAQSTPSPAPPRQHLGY